MIRRLWGQPRKYEEQPPGTMVPRLLEGTDLECSACKGICHTLVSWSPWSGRDERMVLTSGGTCTCPHYGCRHLITENLEMEHNRRLYPEDCPGLEDG